MRLPSFRSNATAQETPGSRNPFSRRLSPSPNPTVQGNTSVNVPPVSDLRDISADGDEEVHYCSPCDRCFASAGELQNHLASNHEGTRSTSPSLWEGQTHSHAETPFPRCITCGKFFGTEENLSHVSSRLLVENFFVDTKIALQHVDICHPYALFVDLLHLPESEPGITRTSSASPSSLVTPRQTERDLPLLSPEALPQGVDPPFEVSTSTGRLSPTSSLESVERRFPPLSLDAPAPGLPLVVRSHEKWCPTCNMHFTSSEEFSRHCEVTGHQSRFLVREESGELDPGIRNIQPVPRTPIQAVQVENTDTSRGASASPRPPVIRTFSLDYSGTDSENEDSTSSTGDVVNAGMDNLLHHCRICDNYFSSLGDLHFHRWSQACIPSLMNKPRPKEPPAPEPTREAVVGQKPSFECPLCMDEETDLSSLACGHIFGTECARSALERDVRCPLCRQPSYISDLRRVFIT